jgi:predicted metalloprotease with PDZ domain
VAIVLSFFTLGSAEEPKCHAPTSECERQIRQMLSGRRYLGIQIADLRPGVIIKAVLPNSPASRAGLDSGDRLISINGKSVVRASAGDVKALLADARPVGVVSLIIQRKGAFRKTEALLEPYPKGYVDKVIANHLSQSHTATAGAQP